MALDAEVIVVGGGPAGSATAFFLARAGCDVLLLDRASFPRDKPCGEYINPEAARVLHDMGALEPLRGLGAARLTGMRIVAPDGGEAIGSFAAGHGYRGFSDVGLAIRRSKLDALLLDRARAAGVRVAQANYVADLVRDGGGRAAGVSVRRSGGGTASLRAALVIGADGLRSVIARRARLGSYRRWPRRIAFVRHYAGVAGMTSMGEMHVAAGGYVGLAPVEDGVVNVSHVMSARRAQARDPAAAFDGWMAGRPHLAARLTNAELVDPPRAVGPFAWGARRAWARGVALVGDAADFHDPFTGEGIYMALRGAGLLAPFALEAARGAQASADRALAAYDCVRRREFSGRWMVERVVALVTAFAPPMNHATSALATRRDLADLLVGVTGGFVPSSEVVSAAYVARLMLAGLVRPSARLVSPPRSLDHLREP